MALNFISRRNLIEQSASEIAVVSAPGLAMGQGAKRIRLDYLHRRLHRTSRDAGQIPAAGGSHRVVAPGGQPQAGGLERRADAADEGWPAAGDGQRLLHPGCGRPADRQSGPVRGNRQQSCRRGNDRPVCLAVRGRGAAGYQRRCADAGVLTSRIGVPTHQ